MKTIESKAASVILQKRLTVQMGGKTYSVPQPTLGTLVMVSELVSQLPKIDSEESFKFHVVLAKARYCKVLGEIMATFVLGAKRLRRSMFARRRVKVLARQIIDGTSASEMYAALLSVLQHIDAKDFFSITTFLEGASVTAPRKVEKTTASGQ